MKTNRHILTTGIALLLAPFAHGQAISIDSAGTCTQTFDTLPTVAGTDWANNSTIPGWYAQTQSTPIPINICDGGGAQPAGLQSIGLAASTERAPGFRLRSANGLGMTRLGLAFQNNTASPLSFGAFSYLGEMWCGHGTANTPDGFQFFYQIGGAAITDLGPFTVNNSGTFAANAAVADTGWTRVAALDYTAINPGVTTPVTLANLGVTLSPGREIVLENIDAHPGLTLRLPADGEARVFTLVEN